MTHRPSGSRIFNPALWLVSKWQTLGGNFKLIGNLTILVSYKNSTKEYISNGLLLILLKFQEPTPVWSLTSENSYQKIPSEKILSEKSHQKNNYKIPQKKLKLGLTYLPTYFLILYMCVNIMVSG